MSGSFRFGRRDNPHAQKWHPPPAWLETRHIELSLGLCSNLVAWTTLSSPAAHKLWWRPGSAMFRALGAGPAKNQTNGNCCARTRAPAHARAEQVTRTRRPTAEQTDHPDQWSSDGPPFRRPAPTTTTTTATTKIELSCGIHNAKLGWPQIILVTLVNTFALSLWPTLVPCCLGRPLFARGAQIVRPYHGAQRVQCLAGLLLGLRKTKQMATAALAHVRPHTQTKTHTHTHADKNFQPTCMAHARSTSRINTKSNRPVNKSPRPVVNVWSSIPEASSTSKKNENNNKAIMVHCSIGAHPLILEKSKMLKSLRQSFTTKKYPQLHHI